MQDTSDEMLQKQREIFNCKSGAERFLIGAETINMGRIIVESSIKQKNPDISPIDLKVSVFRRYYENSFTKEEFDLVVKSMVAYFEKYPENLKF
jgi:hypothetical protein